MNTRPLMMMHVKLGTLLNIGAVPYGARRTAPLGGGTFEGPRLRGIILPGSSADWQLLRSDGVLEMDLRFTLRTDDGALISMRSFGLRHGPPEVIAAIGALVSDRAALRPTRHRPSTELVLARPTAC